MTLLTDKNGTRDSWLRNFASHLVLVPLTAVCVITSLSACSTMSAKSSKDAAANIGPDGAPLDPKERAAIEQTPTTPNDITDSGADLAGVPLAVNRSVFMWIDYFQGQGRPHMERYLQRSTRYMPVMQDILKKEGLPKDLIYIALIESGFASTAKSTANAVGYWQFIRGTGKHYGLQIDSYVDERRDFIRSTQAAADYFKGLYNLFGSWYLAIASYNVGENRVKNVVMKYHTRDFWQLARENKLPEETANYVPKFLAARLIAREPEKYGFTDIEYMPPLEFTEVEFKTGIDMRKLAQEMKIDYDDIRDLNPSYKRGVAFAKNGKLTLRVPKGLDQQALAVADNASADSPKRYVADEDYSYYRVRRGDSIASIAHKFGASQGQIRQLNSMGRHSTLTAGRRIRVPGETVAGLEESEGRSKKNSQAQLPARKVMEKVALRTQKVSQRVHIVRRGENLMLIAQHYRVNLRALAKHNSLKNRSHLLVGSRLEIPAGLGR